MAVSLNVLQPKVHTHPSEVVKDISAPDLEGLNVTFVNMPLREKAVPSSPPEGILLMTTNLRQNYGVNATSIDLNAYRIQDEEAKSEELENGRHLSEAEVQRKIERHCQVHGKPDLVALSGMITTLGWQKKVAKMVKEMFPESLLVSGGGLATELRPTQLNPKGLFGYIPELDAIAHSEGDDVIIKIAYDAKVIRERGRRNALASGVLKPYYYTDIGSKPRLVYGGDRPRDLDIFPWADISLLEEDVDGIRILEKLINTASWGDPRTQNSSAAYFPMAPKTSSVSSRGCPYSCTYCYRGAQGEQKWGIRSARHLAAEVREHIEKYGIVFKSFPDDNFAVRVERIKAMVLGIMHTVLFGIHSNCTWIMGSPTETIDKLKKTVRFILWQIEYYGLHGIPPSAVNQRMFTLTWYPGTKMIRHLKVRQRLSEVFGLTLVKTHPAREEYEPIFNENFEQYCLELDDAVKVLHDPRTGQPLHFSEMTDDEFLEARNYVDSDQTFKILDMRPRG